VDAQTVGAAWRALDKQTTRVRDEKDLERSLRPPTSLRQVFWRWVVQPFIGVVTSFYLLGILYRWLDWRIESLGTAFGLVESARWAPWGYGEWRLGGLRSPAS